MASSHRPLVASSLSSPMRSNHHSHSHGHGHGHTRHHRSSAQSDALPPISTLKLDNRATSGAQVDMVLPLTVNTRVARRNIEDSMSMDVRGVGRRTAASSSNSEIPSPITRTNKKLYLALSENGNGNAASLEGSSTKGAQSKSRKAVRSSVGSGLSSASVGSVSTTALNSDSVRAGDKLPYLQKAAASEQHLEQSQSSSAIKTVHAHMMQVKQNGSQAHVKEPLKSMIASDDSLGNPLPSKLKISITSSDAASEVSPNPRLTLAQELGLVAIDSAAFVPQPTLIKPDVSMVNDAKVRTHLEPTTKHNETNFVHVPNSVSSAQNLSSLTLPLVHAKAPPEPTQVENCSTSATSGRGSVGGQINNGHGSERRSRDGTEAIVKRSRESVDRNRSVSEDQSASALTEVRLFSASSRVLRPCKAEALLSSKGTDKYGLDDARTFLTTPERAELESFEGIVYYLGKKGSKLYGKPNARQSKTGVYYDDDNGSYIAVNPSDHIAFRYAIKHELGSGSFGSVLCCHDYKHGVDVAVKVIKSQSKFTKQAQTELKILNLLNDDSEAREKAHCIKLLGYFSFRNHVCFSFPLYGLNLYDYLKANNFKGVSMRFVKRLAIQIFELLDYLRVKGVVHLDLKPENILLQDEATAKVVVIDFGSSCMANVNPFTYVQSRFYRAPEVLLGCTYGPEVDVWSAACILPEMRSSMPLFPGKDEVDQFGCIVECLDLPPQGMLDRGNRKNKFFDPKGRLLKGKAKGGSSGEELSARIPGSKSIAQLSRARNSSDDAQLTALLTLCLRWEPAERVTPAQVLAHPWLQGSV